MGKVQEMPAAITQWTRLPIAWPRRTDTVRENLADEDPDHRALAETRAQAMKTIKLPKSNAPPVPV